MLPARILRYVTQAEADQIEVMLASHKVADIESLPSAEQSACYHMIHAGRCRVRNVRISGKRLDEPHAMTMHEAHELMKPRPSWWRRLWKRK